MADTHSGSVIVRSPFQRILSPTRHILATQSKSVVAVDVKLGTMGSPREFMFIDSASDRKSANEAVRVHVMRESHRARRQLRGLREGAESTSHGQMTIFSSETPTDAPRPANQPGTMSSREEATFEGQSQTPIPVTESATTSAGEIQRSLSPADISALGQIFELSTKISDPQVLQADLAALCGDDTAPLNALRAVTAFISSDTTAATSPSNTTIIQLESQALEALQTRISNIGDPLHSDQTILTVLLLARLEHARQNTQIGAFHTAALETMLAQRGGREVVAESNPVLALLLSVDVETLRERSLRPADETSEEKDEIK